MLYDIEYGATPFTQHVPPRAERIHFRTRSTSKGVGERGLKGQTHLSRGIDNLSRKLLALPLDDLGKCVFDGGVIGLDEVAVDILDCEG